MGPRRTEILQKELGISTWGQLLEYYPYKYVDRSHIYSIDELQPDMPFVQLKGKILSFEEFSQGPRKKRIVGHFSDGHGVVDLVWFNGTKYVYQQYKVGVEYIVFGKPGIYGGRYQFTHPDIDPVSDVEKLRSSEVESQPLNLGMQPYYMTTEKMKNSGLQSRQRCHERCDQRDVTPLHHRAPPLLLARRGSALGALSADSRRDAARPRPVEVRGAILCAVEHPSLCQRPAT